MVGKNLKKTLCFVLCSLMILSNFSYAYAATGKPKTQANISEKKINEWIAKGYVTKYKNGEFKPLAAATRAEVASVINRTFGFTEKDKANYKDVSYKSTYFNDMAIAKKAGYFMNRKNGTIKPNGAINRQELAYAVMKIMKLEKPKKLTKVSLLKDIKKADIISGYAIEAVIEKGIMEKKTANTFGMKLTVTKAEALAVLEKCIATITRSYDKAGMYSEGNVVGSIAINVPDVTLQNTVIQGDLLIGKGVGEGNVNLKNVTVLGNIIVSGGGMNSIVIENCSINHIIVMKVGNMVRVVAVGTTKVANVEMQSGGKLEESNLVGEGFEMVTLAEEIDTGAPVSLSGNFGLVEVQGDGIGLSLAGGTVENLTVSGTATNTNINLGGTSVINNMNLEASANLEGTGKVTTATIIKEDISLKVAGGADIGSLEVAATAKGSTIDIGTGTVVSNLKVDAQATVKGAGTVDAAVVNATGTNINSTVGKVTSTPGVNVNVSPPTQPGTTAPVTGGGNSSGGGNTNGGGGTSTTAVSAATITGSAVVGQTLTANATPSTATVTYQWMSSDTLGGTYTNITGATGKTYTLMNKDASKFIKVTVTGTGRYTGIQTSVSTAQVAPMVITETPLSVTVNKLTTAPNDVNKPLSQFNQDAIAVMQTGDIVTISGNIAAMKSFALANTTVDPYKWIGLVVDTGEASIKDVKYGVDAFTQDDVDEANSVGAPAGSFLFWIKADGTISTTSTMFTLTKTGKKDTTITMNFVNTAMPVTIATGDIVGVTVPVKGATPIKTIAETTEYTATIEWTPEDATFAADTAYAAIITLTPKIGYTLEGVEKDSFKVAGAVATNAVNSGVITAVFPKTAVNEVPVALSSVAVKTAATKLVYTVGDTLDIAGLVIEGTYSDGSKKNETVVAANVTGFSSTAAAASQTLTVTVGGKTTTYTVEIKAAPITLSTIAVKTAATKLVYTVGDTLDIAGLVIEGTYTDGSKKDETITAADITDFNSTAAVASQTLTVTVGGKTTTYTIEIKETKEITAAKEIPNVIVVKSNGRTLDQIKSALGTTVTLLAGSEEVEVPVTWAADTGVAYNNAAEGAYLLTGTIGALPSGYADAIGTIATVTVSIVVELDPSTDITTKFTDPTFKAEVYSNIKKANTESILYSDVKDLITLDVSGKSISSLNGIEYFTKLTTLNCYSNQLMTLDVSKNTELKTLDCSFNQLATLDVISNTSLTFLECGGNPLTSIDVSKNTKLITLNCYSNQLTILAVSNNTALASLNCSDNQLTDLNVSTNTELTSLTCSSNQLKTLNVSTNTKLATLDVSLNTELATVDVSKNPELTYLSCDGDKIATVDVSKNTKLIELHCDNNILTTLVVTENTVLTTLKCSSNQLTTLELSTNTKLSDLNCNNNRLTTLDISKNTALTVLNCELNEITSIKCKSKPLPGSYKSQYPDSNRTTPADILDTAVIVVP